MAQAHIVASMSGLEDDVASVASGISTKMASKKSPTKGRQKRPTRSTKDNIGSLESKLEEQQKQFSALDEKFNKLFSLMEEKTNRTGTRQMNVLSLDNDLNLEYGIPNPTVDDGVSLRVSTEERRHLLSDDSDSENLSQNSGMEENCDKRFAKYLCNTNSEKPNLCDKFGEDACTKTRKRTGIVLEQNQIDILNESWRATDPTRISAYKENYRSTFPVDESCDGIFKVPTIDDSVEALLVRRFGHKAAFGKAPTLFGKAMKSMERIAFQGQLAARMGLITNCYLQQTLGVLLDGLQKSEPNIDSITQIVRDAFAISTKSLDQGARAGAFHHLIRRRATMYDTGLSEYRNYTSSIMKLPLSADGVFGAQFEKNLKEKKELNKQLKDVLPEISVNRQSASTNTYKRKATYGVSDNGAKKARSDYRDSYRGKSGPSNFTIPRNSYYRGSTRGRNFTVSCSKASKAKQCS